MAGKGAPLGNHNAKRGSWFREALNKALAKDRPALDRVAIKLIAMAEGGDMEAIRELANRLDGRVPQAIVGEDGGPMQHAITVIIQRFEESAQGEHESLHGRAWLPVPNAGL